MKKVEKIMEKIIGNEQEIKNLLNKESIDDLYEFFLEKDNTLTMEEFDNEVYDILENYSETGITDVNEDELEKVSGGKKDFFQKTLATSLSFLTFGSIVGPSALAAETNNRRGSSASVAERKLGKNFSNIRNWFSKNRKAIGIAGGTVTLAAIVAIIIALSVSKHKKSTSPAGQMPNNSGPKSTVSASHLVVSPARGAPAGGTPAGPAGGAAPPAPVVTAATTKAPAKGTATTAAASAGKPKEPLEAILRKGIEARGALFGSRSAGSESESEDEWDEF